MVMWRVNSNGEEDLTVDEFLFCYEPCQIALSRASGRLRIMMQTLGSFKDYLRPIGSGRTDISLCVATTGRGYRKKILGTSSESVGLGGPPRRLVCVFLLVLFLIFVHLQYMICSFGAL